MKQWLGLVAGMLAPPAWSAPLAGVGSLGSYLGVLIAGVGVLLLGVGYLLQWRARARLAVPAAGTAAADPLLPADWSPADLRLLERGSYDARCFTTDVVDMGVRGFLRIGREKRLIGFRWRLVRQPEVDEEVLLPSQRALVTRLFARAEAVELTENNIRRIANAAEVHEDALREHRPRTAVASNRPIVMAGVAFSLLYSLLAVYTAHGEGLAAIAGVVLLSCVLHVAVARRLPKPHDVAAALRERITPLREHLRGVDHASINPDPQIEWQRYQVLLPYALALDLQDIWADTFLRRVGANVAASMVSRLGWYHGSGAEILTDLHELNRALGEGLTAQITSCSTPT